MKKITYKYNPYDRHSGVDYTKEICRAITYYFSKVRQDFYTIDEIVTQMYGSYGFTVTQNALQAITRNMEKHG